MSPFGILKYFAYLRPSQSLPSSIMNASLVQLAMLVDPLSMQSHLKLYCSQARHILMACRTLSTNISRLYMFVQLIQIKWPGLVDPSVGERPLMKSLFIQRQRLAAGWMQQYPWAPPT